MKKNVLFIIHALYMGGAQKSVAAISEELEKDYNIYVCLFNKEHPVFFKHGGKLLSLDVAGSGNIFSKANNFFRRVGNLKSIKKKYEIDVSISFLEGADYANVLSKSNDKVIVSVRGSKMFDENISGLMGQIRKRLLIPFLYNRANSIVALNNGIKLELRKFFNVKPVIPIKVIYNFFDLSRMERAYSEGIKDYNFLAPCRLTLVTHSRISKEKGISHLLYILSYIKGKNIDCGLIIIGDGRFVNTLMSLANELNLSYTSYIGRENELNTSTSLGQADILFAGLRSNPYPLIKAGQIYCFPSHSEGFGNSLVEAMAMGMPVLAADCPWSPREILMKDDTIPRDAYESTHTAIFGDYGILLPNLSDLIQYNHKDLLNHQYYRIWAEAILELWNNKLLLAEYGKKSRSRAETFSKDAIVAQWIKCIEG